MELKLQQKEHLEAPKIIVKPPGPKAKKIIELNNSYVSDLQKGISRVVQVVYDHAYGATVIDVDGNAYVDFTDAVTCCNAGFAHPKVVKAIQEQAAKFLHCYEYPSELRGEVAKLLCEITPGDFEKRVIFSSSGSESNETALRLAELATHKHEIISLWESFHGKTRGVASHTTIPKVRKDLRVLPQAYSIPYPDCNHCFLKLKYSSCGLRCLDLLEPVINFETTGDVAAVIVEPVLGMGCAVPPDDYWPALKEKCEKRNILFIDDEVQTGFGRTGKMWAMEYCGVKPDIITGGKGLANGLPAGSTVCRKDITDTKEMLDKYAGLFTSTHGANPIIMAAAKASIEVYLDEKLPEHAADVGKYVMKRCLEMAEDHKIIGTVQGRGLLIGIELFEKGTNKPSKNYAIEVCRKSFENGLLIFNTGWHGASVKICPALVITQEESGRGLDILDKVFTEIEQKI